MKGPDFICVGAPKCGTTSLYHYLSVHPEVRLPQKKELHFFSRKEILSRVAGPGDSFSLDGCPVSEKDYSDIFESLGAGVSGDISPSYFSNPACLQRIATSLPGVKVIVMLRNPVEKSYSQYMHLVREARENLTFSEALDVEAQRASSGYSDFWLYSSGSLYSETVERVFLVFGRENCHVIFQEDLSRDRVGFLGGVCEFIGVGPVGFNEVKVFNRSGVPRFRVVAKLLAPGPFLRVMKKIIPPLLAGQLKSIVQDANTGVKVGMSVDDRVRLVNFFREDVERLSAILGVEVPWDDFKSV